LVKALKDKPVKFLAVSPNTTLGDALTYQRTNNLAMATFADNLNLMEKRYGLDISLKNIWQYRVIGPDGKIVGYDMSQPALEKLVSDTKAAWKYKSGTYEAALEPALDLFEANQHAAGMKLLIPLRKSTNKALAEQANKLFDTIKQEGEEWKTKAESMAGTDALEAYDLYAKVAAVFASDPLGKSVAEPMKKLAADKSLAAELAARKAFSQYYTTVGKMTPAQKSFAVKFCQDTAKKHSGTPTGEKAAALAKELGG
jgi:hypothetical protein